MIKKFDGDNLKDLRNDINAAFAAVCKKHGVTLSIGTISYDPEGAKATTRLTMIATGDPNVASDPRAAHAAKIAAEFKRHATAFGLKPEQLGATFTYRRSTYKLAGLNPRARTTPILAADVSNGTVYRLPEAAVASLQTAEYKKIYGITDTPSATGAVTCSNVNSFDFTKGVATGKCTRPATTSRKDGFGRNAKHSPYCAECAQLIDESRREMEAEARCS